MDPSELGGLLCEEKIINSEQLKKALQFQKELGGKLPVLLIKLGYAEEEKLLKFFSRNQSLPIIDLGELILPENLIRKIPRDVIEKYQILPISLREGTLTVAVFDPFDLEALQELQIVMDCRINIILAKRSQIQRSIVELFYSDRAKTKEELLKEIEQGEEQKEKKMALMNVFKEALLPLLIEKGIVTEEELERKARELRLTK